MMATVGLVGLGLLGHAVAARLRAKGHEVVGYDVLPEKIQGLVALGGRGASSAAGNRAYSACKRAGSASSRCPPKWHSAERAIPVKCRRMRQLSMKSSSYR